MSNLNEFDRLVFLTLAYSSCFSFALSFDEIILRLPKTSNLSHLMVSENFKNNKKFFITKKKIEYSLKKLLKLSIIKTNGKYFYLNKKDLFNRNKKSNLILKKEKEINDFVSLVKKISFVKAIVLTGSTAVGNASEKDDLDFMIICQKGTLWITRLILIILTKIKHKRPQLGKGDAWCFNLLLDEGDLIIKKDRRSLYEAYEILQMIFVFDRGNIKQFFMNANQWVKNYLFFYEDFKFKKYNKDNNFYLFNNFLFFIQKTYRLLFFGKENFSLTETQAFFNDINFKKKIFTKLAKKIDIFNG